MNTLEIDTLLKKHPHSRPVFKGGLCQKQTIKRTFGPCGKYGSRPSKPTHEGNTTIQPDVHRTNPLTCMSIS